MTHLEWTGLLYEANPNLDILRHSEVLLLLLISEYILRPRFQKNVEKKNWPTLYLLKTLI